jgi:predicted component of type VI protein secretion system
MPYTNKFADGHSHSYTKTSPKGLPQCAKCGAVSTKGQKFSNSRSTSAKSPIQQEFSGFDFSDLVKPAPKPKPKPKQKPKANVNKEVRPQDHMMGEQYKIETTMKPSEAKFALDRYLKNRLSKAERMRQFPERFNQ